MSKNYYTRTTDLIDHKNDYIQVYQEFVLGAGEIPHPIKEYTDAGETWNELGMSGLFDSDKYKIKAIKAIILGKQVKFNEKTKELYGKHYDDIVNAILLVDGLIIYERVRLNNEK